MPVNEGWITAEEMAEAIKKAKLNRRSKAAAFIRVKNRLDTLLSGEAEEATLKQVYNELAESFKTLEETHEELCLLLDNDTYVTEEGYLDEHREIYRRCS